MFKECLEEYASGSSEDVMDELLPRFKIVSDMRCRDPPLVLRWQRVGD